MWIFTKIKRFINQNNFNILFAIIICVFAIVLIQVFNGFAKEQQINEGIARQSNILNTSSNTSLAIESQSPVTQEIVGSDTGKEHEELINQFVEYCNNNEIEQAYNMLTDNCKKELYPSISVFEDNYHKNIFTEIKSCSIEFWNRYSGGYTYRVKILQDILSSGKYDLSGSYEDYFTVIEQDDKLELNISSLVNKVDINKEIGKNDVIVNVISKIVYIDYEIYEVKISNNTDKTILIDSNENKNSVYLYDTNDIKYPSFITEIMTERLVVRDLRFYSDKNKI